MKSVKIPLLILLAAACGLGLWFWKTQKGGTDNLSPRLDRLQRAFAWLHHEIGPQQPPASVWPQSWQDIALAEKSGLEVAEIHTSLKAGLASHDLLQQAQALQISGRRDEALAQFEAVLNEPTPDARRARLAWEGKSQIADDRMQYKSALASSQKAIALTDQNEDPAAWLNAQWTLAVQLRFNSRYKEAEHLLRQTLEGQEKAQGPDHPEVAETLDHLVGVLSAGPGNRLAETEPLLRRRLKILQAVQSSDAPAIAAAHGDLAHLLQLLSRPEEAIQERRLQIDIHDKTQREHHPMFADILSTQARLLSLQKRPLEAVPYCRRAVEIIEATEGPDSSAYRYYLLQWATVLEAAGQPQEAEPLLLRIFQEEEKKHGADSISLASSLRRMVKFYLAQKRPADAVPFLRRQISLDEKEHGKDAFRLGPDLTLLADILVSLGQSADAAPVLERVVINAEKYAVQSGYRVPDIKNAKDKYFQCLKAQGLPETEIETRLSAARRQAGLLP